MTRGDLRRIAGELNSRSSRIGGGPLPSRTAVSELVELARPLLFPHLLMEGDGGLETRLEDLLTRFCDNLLPQLQRAMACERSDDQDAGGERTADEICTLLVERLVALQSLLVTDVEAAMVGDPALEIAAEAMLCYPGITAVMCFRLAHELHVLGAPLLPRMITAYAHSITSIDIHPGASIGPHFFIDHGSGVVVGATAVVGARVRLYQGVTLGARSFPVDERGRVVKGQPRHPIVEDDVVIYAGATVLGRVTIGRGATIGGNVWVTRDVAAGDCVTQAKSRHQVFSHGGGI